VIYNGGGDRLLLIPDRKIALLPTKIFLREGDMFSFTKNIIADVQSSEVCSLERLLSLYALKEKIVANTEEYRKIKSELNLPQGKRSTYVTEAIITSGTVQHLCESLKFGLKQEEVGAEDVLLVSEEGELAAELLLLTLSDAR
ncbi:unnamed protein product, partial [Heterosigma akashiwo]